MPNCPDCGRETDRPARCAACSMVERALTPPGTVTAVPSRPRAAEPRAPTVEAAPVPRSPRVWGAWLAGFVVGFAAGVAAAWGALAR